LNSKRINAHPEEREKEAPATETTEANKPKQTESLRELNFFVGYHIHKRPRFHTSQLPPIRDNVINVLNGALTNQEYQQCSDEIRQIIAAHASATRELIQNCGGTFDDIQALTAEEFSVLVQQLGEVEILVNVADIPLKKLLELEQPLRDNLVKYAAGVAILTREGNINLNDLLGLQQQTLDDVLMQSEKVARLVNKAHTTITDLLELEEGIRNKLLKKSRKVAKLIKHEPITFEQLSRLSVPELRIVLTDPKSEASQEILYPPYCYIVK
jgi:hypothetical protein